MTIEDLQLAAEDKRALEPILARLSERARVALSAESLAFKWAQFVEGLEQGYDDSIYEYTNDVNVRALLNQIIMAAPAETATRIQAYLKPYDDRFREKDIPLIKPLRRDALDEEWWWRFAPASAGEELKADLQAEGFLEN